MWRRRPASRQRGVVTSAAVAVLVVTPMWMPWVLVGLAISEFLNRRWITGAVLAVCGGCVYVAVEIGARRLVRWAERRGSPLK